MAVTIKVPVCNIIACENIVKDSDNKMCICNPFTSTSGRNIKKFYTYTVIQGMPNGNSIFKIQIANPNEKIIRQTDDTCVLVEENLIRIKTQWSNIILDETGEYTIRVLIKCNNEFEVVGSSHIYVF